MLANLSFDEAQKWLYFMARALEYKWNTPFTNYFYLGRRWSTPTLFKLRNAEELETVLQCDGQLQQPRPIAQGTITSTGSQCGRISLDTK